MFDKVTKDIIDQIQSDVNTFVSTELSLYMANSDNKDFSNSVIANIALLDLSSIATENGYAQMERLLGNHYDQMVERRMHQFVAYLMIRYGKDTIYKIKDIVVDAQCAVYKYENVDDVNFKVLNGDYITFWLVPFIKHAYDEIILTIRPNT